MEAQNQVEEDVVDQEIDTTAENTEENQEVNETQTDVEESNHQEETPEQRAGRMGWKPQADFKGKGDWVDAESFLKRTEEEGPQLKHSLTAMERNYRKLEKSMDAIMKHQERELEATKTEAYNKAKRELETGLKQAVEDGDTEAAQKLFTAQEELSKTAHKAPEVAQPDPEVVKETVNEWMSQNSWYNNDQELNGFATSYEDSLARQGMGLDERLEKTTEYIKTAFPHKFQPKKAPAMNGTGGNNVRVNKTPKAGTYEALNKEAKTECDRMMKGYKNSEDAKATYLKYATPEMFI